MINNIKGYQMVEQSLLITKEVEFEIVKYIISVMERMKNITKEEKERVLIFYN